MAVRGDQTHAPLLRLRGFAEKLFAVVLRHAHGGPRDEAPGVRNGASDPVGMKCPAPQCPQACHSIRSTRRLKASTDSTATGSGVGASSAERASANRLTLRAGASKP